MSAEYPNEPTLTRGDKIRSFIIIGLLIGVVSVVIYFDPVGKLLGSWITKGQNTPREVALRNLIDLLNGLIGVVGVAIVAFVSLMVQEYFSERSRAERKRPKFFEEMQSTLQAILIPLGFLEVEGANNNLTRDISFLRYPLGVRLWLDVRDGIYYVQTTSVSFEDKFDRKPDDFSVEGTIFYPDGFKGEVLAKLNEWLVKRGQVS